MTHSGRSIDSEFCDGTGLSGDGPFQSTHIEVPFDHFANLCVLGVGGFELGEVLVEDGFGSLVAGAFGSEAIAGAAATEALF